MDLIPLPLFPEGALDASVTTTVWVGVWVVVFFSLRLGWPLSGLVVPGYLVPLLIAKPAAALVVGLEAVLTYLLVWVLSERLGRRYAWCSFFGRDRFFALLLASVLVRWLLDVWLLPWASAQVLAYLGQPLEYGQQLHSFGLVVVALTANYFWKPGLWRGLGMLVVNTAATWLLVRWVLMEYTNFSVGNLQYLYEDVAASLLASPKAYILLLTTALLASRLNLHYGWDFNGILIPALLALQWYAPGKIVASFCEAGVVLALALLALKLPWCRRTTMEGGRKILLFFNLAFFYRLVLGFVVPIWWPEWKSTDLYGFGYLLSTLLAVRAHDFQRAVGLVRGSLQVSLAGALGGSVIGFGLTLLPLTSLPPAEPGTAPCGDVRRRLDGTLVDLLRRDKLRWYQAREPGVCRGPSLCEVELFREGLERLQQYVADRQPQRLDDARQRLARVNYGVYEVEGHYLYLREFEPQRGWGLYVLDLQHPEGVLIEVPAPRDEWAVYESGLGLWHALRGGTLAIAGARRPGQPGDPADVLIDSQSLFASFHRTLHRGNTLQVRGDDRESPQALAAQGRRATEIQRSSYRIKRTLPSGVPLDQLQRAVPDLDLQWHTAAGANALRDMSWSGFGELLLSRTARRHLAEALPSADPGQASGGGLATTAANLAGLLLDLRLRIAARGTNLYVPARSEELLFLDEEVLRPLIRLARVSGSADWTDADWSELRVAALAARTLGYQVRVIRDSSSREDFLLLTEELGGVPRSWGAYALRCGLGEPFVLEVPRPIAERNTVEFGVSLLGRLRPAAWLMAGAHPRANLDGSADVTRTANRVNLFHLVHQVLLRELGSRPVQVVQVRAVQELIDADLLVATSDGKTRADELDPLTRRLLAAVGDDRLCIRFVGGIRETASYEPDTVQLAAMNLTAHKTLTTLWLVPEVRREYEMQGDNQLQAAQFLAVGIPTVQANLDDYAAAAGPARQPCLIPEALRRQLDEYAVYHDVVRLQQLCRQWPQFQFTRLLDVASQQAFLLIRGEGSGPPAVFPLQAAGSRVVTGGTTGQPAVQGMTRVESAASFSWEVATRP